MKSTKLALGAILIALGFTSCKSEKETQAEKTVETYVVYVDSLGNVAAADAKANWQSIESSYQTRSSEVDAAIVDIKNNEAAQTRIDASKAKYEEMKAKYQAELDAEMKMADQNNYKSRLRKALFMGGSMGDDMSFNWVNKDNILKVYNDFNNEYDKNHNNYTREDFDEIKALYEALDSRKNTVEKEGLSSSDNRKIAELKFKFGPKFKADRMGAKATENSEAKE